MPSTTPLPMHYYPRLVPHPEHGSRSECLYGNDYSMDLVAHSAFYLSNTLDDCCTKHGCDDMKWYPLLFVEANAQECKFGADWPEHLKSSGLLYDDEVDCCSNWTCLHWTPDPANVEECLLRVPDNWMMDPANRDHFVYDTREKCCEFRACTSDDGSAGITTTEAPVDPDSMWYPEFVLVTGSNRCVFGVDYKGHPIEGNPDKWLFDDQDGCCSEFLCDDYTPTTASPTGPPSATPTKSPSVSPSPGPTLAPTDYVTKVPMMWYPNDYLEDNDGRNVCVRGEAYSSSWIASFPDLYLFDNEHDCCEKFDCDGYYMRKWYPLAAVPPLGRSGCAYGNEYQEVQLLVENPNSHLFDSQVECCLDFGPCDDLTTDEPTGAPTSNPTVYVTGTPLKWYANYLIDGFEGERKCVLGEDYALPGNEFVANNPDLYLFDDEHSCCEAGFDCVGYLSRRWYPFRDGCVHGNDYGFIPEKFLFDSQNECCAGTDAGAVDCVDFDYRPPEPEMWYQSAYVHEGTAGCVYGNGYQEIEWLVGNDSFLFGTEAECCERRGPCPDYVLETDGPTAKPTAGPTTAEPTAEPTVQPSKDMPEMWYQSAFVIYGAVGCVHDDDYKAVDWMVGSSFLYDTEAECCERQGPCPDYVPETDAPTAKPTAGPTTAEPTGEPTEAPSKSPSIPPTQSPSKTPTKNVSC